jgi:thioredoxin-related protein
MKPIVHGLEAKYGDRIQFTYLDIDDPNTGDLKHALGYRVQPHIFLLDGGGNVVRQWLGFVSEEEFVSVFEQVLN